MDETEHFVLFRPSRHSAPGVPETPTIPANRCISAATATLAAVRESPANPRLLTPNRRPELGHRTQEVAGSSPASSTMRKPLHVGGFRIFGNRRRSPGIALHLSH
jgi:hypothetical protein